PARLGWIDRDALREAARVRLARVGLAELDPDRLAGSLGIAQQQLVEIDAALSAPGDVLILDEPTASLGDAEAERLFAEMKAVTSAGAAIVYVSHRLEEVRRVADR